jgi:hypothetical protein
VTRLLNNDRSKISAFQHATNNFRSTCITSSAYLSLLEGLFGASILGTVVGPLVNEIPERECAMSLKVAYERFVVMSQKKALLVQVQAQRQAVQVQMQALKVEQVQRQDKKRKMEVRVRTEQAVKQEQLQQVGVRIIYFLSIFPVPNLDF